MTEDSKLCSFDNCGRPKRAFGLCREHRTQQLKGKPLTPIRQYTKNGLNVGSKPTKARKPTLREKVLARDDDGNKQCTRCEMWLPESYYRKAAYGADRLTRYCSKCASDYDKIQRYKLDSAQWQALFDSQGRKCAGCSTVVPGGKGWHIDHDHACCPGTHTCGGCVRGILCGGCNAALGLVRDSKETLQTLIAYLDR